MKRSHNNWQSSIQKTQTCEKNWQKFTDDCQKGTNLLKNVKKIDKLMGKNHKMSQATNKKLQTCEKRSQKVKK